MRLTLGELAVRFGCTLVGDPERSVAHVGTLESADNDALTFLAQPRWRRFLASTRAGVVVLDPKLAAECPVPALLSTNPYATYARMAALLHPPATHEPGIHPSACVDATASVDPTAWVGPKVVIEAHARIAARVSIGPGCVVMQQAQVGADSRLCANVTLGVRVVIGERCILQPGAVVGGDGFGFAKDRGQWVKIPQVGSVRLGNDVEIGANTTIDRGAIEDTVIGDDVKLDNLIQIGHNVVIGMHTAIAACTGVSGSTRIGQRCLIGGQVGIAGQLSICDDVVLLGTSFVSNNIRKPGVYSSGLPVEEAARFRKNAARFYQLDELARTVRQLQRAGAANQDLRDHDNDTARGGGEDGDDRVEPDRE
jgi:UDP-3-O-[3-hydroxymyristoyl] glucosamine N-acyltransferase